MLWLRNKLYRYKRAIQKRFIKKTFLLKSYSQDGEDRILWFYFLAKKKFKGNGFYVDVGAFDPARFSNTKIFYDSGWSGINIDATPGTMMKFDSQRPRDKNLELAVGNTDIPRDYYLFKQPGLNGFLSKEFVESDYKNEVVLDCIRIESVSLSNILSKYLPNGQQIHFLSIDVEGQELDVLKSNDWEKFRPQVILVETHYLDLEKLDCSEVYNFLGALRYTLMAKTNMTSIFCSE